jgi:ELWxxDGT repeat protein
VLVKDIAPGEWWSSPSGFAYLNGAVYFTATDNVHGYELWKTDGTNAGTVMVKDVCPGPRGGTDFFGPVLGSVFGSVLVFQGNDCVTGTELWATDGTSANTHLVADVGPVGGSGPDSLSFTQAGSLLYFVATTNATGAELYAVPMGALMDSDLDGLDYATETAQGTNPFDADTDDDGLTDGAEVNTHGTNPLLADTDGDGFSDFAEVSEMHTNPLDPNDPPAPEVPLAGPLGLVALAAGLMASSRRPLARRVSG